MNVRVTFEEDDLGTLGTESFNAEEVSTSTYDGGRAIVVLMDKDRKPIRTELFRRAHRISIIH